MTWFLLFMGVLYIVMSFPVVNALIASSTTWKKDLIKSQHDRFLFAALWPVLINLALLGACTILCLAMAFALIRALLYLPSLVLAPAWDYVFFKMYPGEKENSG